MTQNIIKSLALLDELETSIKLIQLGLGELQNIDAGNIFYHLPFQLISSGFERLMKCHICLGHIETHNEYPKPSLFQNKLKHDLLKIKQHILKSYFNTKNRPALEDDLEFMTQCKKLNHLIGLLSKFGQFARYYNLDVVSGKINPDNDIESLWKEYKNSLLLKDTDLLEKLDSYEKSKEVSDTLTRHTIIILEKFTRAIARQFTLGGLGKQAQQYSSVVFPFLMLSDHDLGTTDYRKQTTRYNEKERKPHKRTLKDEIERRTNNK